MTTTYLHPTGTSANTGAVVGAGGDADVSQSDFSDASYIQFEAGESATFTLADLTLPSGAILIYAQGTASVGSLFGAGDIFRLTINVGGAKAQQTAIRNVSAVTKSLATVSFPTDAELDAATLKIEHVDTGLIDPLNVYQSMIRVLYYVQPEATIVYPTGTLDEDNAPTMIWTVAWDPEFTPAASKYRVRIFTDDQHDEPGFDPDVWEPYLDSGIVTVTTGVYGSSDVFSHDLEEGLPNDTYWSYVQVAAFDTQWSDWNAEEFVIDVPVPAEPLFVATSDADNGRVILQWTDVAGDATTEGAQIQRMDEAGEWQPVRLLDNSDSTENIPGGGEDGFVAEGGDVPETGGTVWDYEILDGVENEYRLRAWHDYSATAFGYSEWVYASTTVELSEWWLKHPTQPNLNQAVVLRSFNTQTRAVRQSVQHPLGRSDAVVVSDTRGPEMGTVVFRADDDDTRDYLKAIATATRPLLLQGPITDHEPNRWMILGDEEVSRLLDAGWSVDRNLTYSFVVVQRPEGPIEAW